MSAAPEKSLTAYVAGFIVNTRAKNIPADVMHLGKRSILDGIGLALAGSVSESGHIVRKHLQSLGCKVSNGCTVIGSGMKMPARFAAFANGVAIHADDYDDTQLAAATDRVYGLLTHPTAPALPPVLPRPSRVAPPAAATPANIADAATTTSPVAATTPTAANNDAPGASTTPATGEAPAPVPVVPAPTSAPEAAAPAPLLAGLPPPFVDFGPDEPGEVEEEKEGEGAGEGASEGAGNSAGEDACDAPAGSRLHLLHEIRRGRQRRARDEQGALDAVGGQGTLQADHRARAVVDVLDRQEREDAAQGGLGDLDHRAKIPVSRAARPAAPPVACARERFSPTRTNGKVERFHQTMAREWAYGLSYRSHRQRNQALPHGDRPPISRVHNVRE